VSDELRFEVGRHDQAIETLQTEVTAMRKDVSEIKTMIAQTKGGFRTLIAVGSVAAAVGAAVAKGITMLKGGGP
jgi:phage shock protein A